MLDAVIIAQVAEGLDKFLNTFIKGVSLGAIYAMLALGFVIIFKATQVVNFAHGAIAAFGAWMVAYVATIQNFPGRFVTFLPYGAQWILSAIVAVLITALLGILIERTTIRPMIGKPLFAVAIITLGLDLILRFITNDFMGNQPRGLGDPWGAQIFESSNIRIAAAEAVTIGVTVGLVLVLAWFFRTKTGVAMRATSFDQEAALAQGINVGRIFALAWAMGAALAAIGGIFASVFPRGAAGVHPGTAFVAFAAFPAVVIGGLDSIVGAIVGGLLVGLVQEFVATYAAAEFSFLGLGFAAIVPWLLMMAVLLVKPYGIFGTEEIRRV